MRNPINRQQNQTTTTNVMDNTNQHCARFEEAVGDLSHLTDGRWIEWGMGDGGWGMNLAPLRVRKDAQPCVDLRHHSSIPVVRDAISITSINSIWPIDHNGIGHNWKASESLRRFATESVSVDIPVLVPAISCISDCLSCIVHSP